MSDQLSPNSSSGTPYKVFKKFKVLDALYHNEPALRYFTLLISSVVLSIVSFTTTYLGFLALTEHWYVAAALGVAIQCTLFWTARELARRGFRSKEAVLFLIAASLSVVFSYVSIAETIASGSRSGTDLGSRISQSLSDLQLRINVLSRAVNLSDSSAERWDQMGTVEFRLGSSTARQTVKGRGGLWRVYRSYAKTNREAKNSLQTRLIQLEAEQNKLIEAQKSFDGGDPEKAATLFTESLVAIKGIYIPQEIAAVVQQVRLQEDDINKKFFAPSASLNRIDSEFSFDIPRSIPDVISIPSIIDTRLGRAEQALRDLFTNISWRTSIAAFMAIGLDFMVLICSFATNFGVPLRVVPNQELTVDALLHAETLKSYYPSILINLKLERGRPTIEIDVSSLAPETKIPFMDLLEKHKVKRKNDRLFEVAPDFLYYLLAEVYYGARHRDIAQSLATNPRVREIVKNATFNKGKIQIASNNIPTDSESAIALLNLEINGLLKKRGLFKPRFVFSREFIEVFNYVLTNGGSLAK